MKKAIIFGASGFVGSQLLTELLNNSDYEKVIVVVRKDLNISHPKLLTLLGDYHTLLELKSKIVGDDIFIVLGTTQKHTPNKEEYYQIDHDYPLLAAKIAKGNGAKSLFLVTAIGANANSSFSYVKIKGEIERDCIALNFEHTHIFQPSMIMGTRKEKRPLEKMFIKLWSVINPLLLGSYLRKYKGIDGKDIAKAMNNSAKRQLEKVKVYQWKEMNDLLSLNTYN